MKNSFIILIFILILCSCASNGTKRNEVVKVKKNTYFNRNPGKIIVPSEFNDNNTLALNNGVLLRMISIADDEYRLKVNFNDLVVLSIDSIQSISKVWYRDHKIYFSVYTYFDEDGNNEGFAYIIDRETDKVIKYPDKLRNTCNPVLYNGMYCFLNEGTIILADEKLQKISTVNLGYEPAKKNGDLSFLDTYNITSLSVSKNADQLQIMFTPDKTKESFPYSGQINNDTGNIVFKN